MQSLFDRYMAVPHHFANEFDEDQTWFGPSIRGAQGWIDAVRRGMPSIPKIDCKFMAEMRAVAWCRPRDVRSTEDGRHYEVAISMGLGLQCLELCFAIFSHPDIFPDIGVARDEDATRIDRGAMTLGFETVTGRLDWNDLDRMTDFATQFAPLNQTRMHAALFLYHMLLMLIWLHEIRHVVDGHCGFAKVNLDMEALFEEDDGSPCGPAVHDYTVGDQTKDRYYLELEADASAAVTLAPSLMGGSGQFIDLKAFPSLTATNRLEIMLFATILLPWLWWVWRDLRGVGASETHPHPSLRMLNAMLFADRIAQSVEEADDYRSELRAAATGAVQNAVRLAGVDPRCASIASNLTQERIREYRSWRSAIVPAMRDLRGRLKPFAYV